MQQENGLQIVLNTERKNNDIQKANCKLFSSRETNKIRAFHKSFPQYTRTPLIKLEGLSKEFGLKGILVKDESYRFNLNSFKVLGGAYAIGKYVSNAFNLDNITYNDLKSQEIKEKLKNLTFITATDGNHGRGVAWIARELGCKSIVYMPKGSALSRLENIRKEGAEASITEYNYDDCVKYAKNLGEKNDWVVVQDTTSENYEQVPSWIMQGYTTIIDEIIEQLSEENFERPTHLILQAGVGAFAGAILGYLVENYGEKRPSTIIIEPENAACIYSSAKIKDGKPHEIKGDLSTIMAGLACGDPNKIGWEILRDYADAYISCDDSFSAMGMRILGNPLDNDLKIISGESGAVGMGLLYSLMKSKKYESIKEKLKLNEKSNVLIISTEGATDPVGYKKIIWDGEHPGSL